MRNQETINIKSRNKEIQLTIEEIENLYDFALMNEKELIEHKRK